MSRGIKAVAGAALGFIIGGPAGAVAGAALFGTKAGEKLVNKVLDFVLQPFMPNIPGIDSSAESQRQQGVLLQREGSIHHVPVVYGYRKVGGIVSFVETGASNNKYLYVAYVFSEGLVEGLREVFIDDYPLPVDQVGNLNAGQLVTVNSDRYKDRVQMRWSPGVYYSDPRSSTLGTTVKGDIFAEAPSFTNTMVYNGLATLFVRYEWKEIKTQSDADNNPFNGNVPQVQVSILGKRVASLLTNETELYNYDTNPVRYSTNPAECLLDYLRNPRYGKGLLNSDIDWTTWKKAARKCNQTVTYVASGIQGPILTMNGVVDTGQNLMNNVKTMLQNFRAYMPYVQGKYKLRIEDAGNDTDILSGSATIVYTLTKDDIVGGLTYIGIDKSSKYNIVEVTYIDPDQKFTPQSVIYPETEEERQVYIDRDGGRENKYGVTLGHITNYAIAKDMARLIFNKQRRQESCTMTVTSKVLDIEPGDCVRIQSNLLNFGTDPWRVVSTMINNDMTIELGCVRNPDDIYPYVRVGEEDIVLPPYIPKGSIVYYPSSDNRIPLGLVPPTYAVFPPSTTPVSTNPAPTDPNAPGGGGVGGGNPPDGTVNPGTTTPTPVPDTNVTPAPVPPPVPFDAVLTLKKTTSVDQGNRTSSFNIIFTQPSNALYEKSIFWWRLNPQSPWTSITLDAKPGPGGEINVVIPGVPNTYTIPYIYYVRSYASDGRASTNVLRGSFQTIEDQATGAFVGTGSASPTQVAEGWTLPAEVQFTSTYDDNIDYFAIQPKLPSDPRRLQIKIQQLVNTISTPRNPLISGFSVFYRFVGDTYWEKETFTYPGNYTFGELTYDMAGDFGARGTLGSLQQYEFFVRLEYSDGKPALKQLGPAKAPVEESGTGLTTYDIFGTKSFSASVSSLPIPSNFTFTLSQQVNSTFAVGSDIVPAVRIYADVNTNKLTFYFTPPNNSRWRGYTIRYREVIAGQAPAFNTVPVGITASNGVVTAVVQGSPYAHGRNFEWAITAKYYDTATSTIKDATFSLYGKITIPIGDTNYSYIDLYDKFFTGTQPIATTLALGNLQSTFPALPTINPKSWTKIQNKNAGSFGDFPFGQDMYNAGLNYRYLNNWYQLKFQADGSSDNIVIYRRVYDANAIVKNTAASSSKWYGLGAWEKKTVALSSLTTDSDGWKILNVRGPINSTLFDAYYEVTGWTGRTLYDSKYGPAPNYFPYSSYGSSKLSDIYPYYGLGNSAVSTSRTRYAEFIFVLATGATEQTKGLRLTEFYAAPSGADYKYAVDGFISGNVRKDEIVTVSDYNSFTNGYKRNINEALTGIAFANLNIGGYQWGGNGVPMNPSNSYTFTSFLLQPTTGETVY